MVVLAVGAGLLGVAPAFAADGVVVSRGAAVSATYRTDSAKKLTLAVPAEAQAGDVLVASIGFGRAGAKSQPRLRPPAGWKLVSRVNHGTAGALAVYWHVFTAGETSYAWRTDVKVGGIVFLAAFGGVDTANPIDVSAGAGVSGKGRPVSTPSVTTSVAGEALVSSYFAYKRLPAGVGSCAKLIPRAKLSATAKARRRRCAAAASTTWKAPRGMNEIGDANNGAGRSGSLDARVQTTAGAYGQEDGDLLDRTGRRRSRAQRPEARCWLAGHAAAGRAGHDATRRRATAGWPAGHAGAGDQCRRSWFRHHHWRHDLVDDRPGF